MIEEIKYYLRCVTCDNQKVSDYKKPLFWVFVESVHIGRQEFCCADCAAKYLLRSEIKALIATDYFTYS